MNIFIGSLHFGLTEDELREAFEQYGTVDSAKIITDKYTGKSKGFGFVEMPDDDDAQHAIDELNGAEIKGRPVNVNKAKERENNNNKRSFNRNNRRY